MKRVARCAFQSISIRRLSWASAVGRALQAEPDQAAARARRRRPRRAGSLRQEQHLGGDSRRSRAAARAGKGEEGDRDGEHAAGEGDVEQSASPRASSAPPRRRRRTTRRWRRSRRARRRGSRRAARGCESGRLRSQTQSAEVDREQRAERRQQAATGGRRIAEAEQQRGGADRDGRRGRRREHDRARGCARARRFPPARPRRGGNRARSSRTSESALPPLRRSGSLCFLKLRHRRCR